MTRVIKTTFGAPGKKYAPGRKRFHKMDCPRVVRGVKLLSEQGCRSLGLTPCKRCLK